MKAAVRALLGLAVVLALVTVAAAQERRVPRTGRRVALVIGNDAYPTMPLRNATNDAQAVAAALQELEFTVDVQVNTDGSRLERAVREFTGRLRPGDVAFFFYAGHGIQLDGENYLVPTDFDALDEPEAKRKAYSADLVCAKMEASGAKLSLIVLDACRDNPFRFTRSGSRGLAAFEGAGRGTLIALATGPGKTASDNAAARNGLFTQHLLEALRLPGLKVQEVFERARQRVDEASGQRQTPWLLSNVIGDFYLRPPVPATASETAARPADAAARAEVAQWGSIRDSEDPQVFEDYLSRHPGGVFAEAARDRLAQVVVHARPLPPEDASVQAARAALGPDPANASLRLALGEALLKNQRRREALGEATTVLAADPQHHEALDLQARALLELKDFTRALATADGILQRNPSDLKAAFLRVSVFEAQRDYAATAAALEALLARAPQAEGNVEKKANDRVFLTHLGFAYQQLGRNADAVRAFERARDAGGAPDAGLLGYLCESLILARDLERALREARAARQRFPGDADLALLEARVLSAKGDTAAALGVIEHLRRTAPDPVPLAAATSSNT